jgi:3',5'-cyclic AMP phosphodiesterase CpdA
MSQMASRYPVHASSLVAISDLHVSHGSNRALVERLKPSSTRDWLIVAGDITDSLADFDWTLGLLANRFEKVLWVPGNHELWSWSDEPEQFRGNGRYEHLVKLCRDHGVITPEDPIQVWHGSNGPVAVVLLFLLYDYSFGWHDGMPRKRVLELAEDAGVLCSDEALLRPDPFETREAWCHERLRISEERLSRLSRDLPTILVNHFPLNERPTQRLLRREFAPWCGTRLTADWHLRFRARAVVYGHLHIPHTAYYEGVRFEEVSLGYPREQSVFGRSENELLRQILPGPAPGSD